MLKKYCSLEDVWEQIVIDGAKASDGEVLREFTDGEYYKRHSFFRENPQALRLHLYEDEFEIVNPLGPKKNKYKLAAFYYTVGNIGDKYRSRMSHTHLALMVRYVHLKESGLDAVLKPIIDDLRSLSCDGFTITCDGIEQNIKAALATISCDNLSAHMIGGFSSSFSSGRVCRFCMASYSDVKKHFCEEDFVLRTREGHAYHLESVIDDRERVALYGVQSRCPLSDLDYFDVTKTFPPDVMHDVLEGVVPLVMKLVIREAKKQKHITIPEFNDELKHLRFGKNDIENRPVPITAKSLRKCIVGSASQKWCLFRLLPILMAHRVPPGSAYWNVYLLSREIVEIILASQIRKDDLMNLKMLIEEFLAEMSNVFGNVLTPKCHYLLHYPRLILMYGPLRYLWCMRYESKHQYFKELAKVTKNLRNVTHTLCTRHQFKQCWEFSSNLMCAFERSKCKSVSTPFSALPIDLQNTLKGHGAFQNVQFEGKRLQRVSELHVNNVKYALENVFVVGHVHAEEIPLFLKVKYIINVDTCWVLCGKMLIPVLFDSHIHAYQVRADPNWSLLHPGDEVDFHPLDVYSIDDQLFVPLKYFV